MVFLPETPGAGENRRSWGYLAALRMDNLVPCDLEVPVTATAVVEGIHWVARIRWTDVTGNWEQDSPGAILSPQIEGTGVPTRRTHPSPNP